MSGLDALLAGDLPAGAYRWRPGTAYAGADRSDPGEPLARLRERAEAAGWSMAHLDGATIPDVAALHDALAAALALPAHYGRNLDALHDVVADLPTPTLVVWDGWDGFAREHPRTTRLVLRVLGERLHVVVAGPGPDDEVPLPELGPG